MNGLFAQLQQRPRDRKNKFPSSRASSTGSGRVDVAQYDIAYAPEDRYHVFVATRVFRYLVDAKHHYINARKRIRTCTVYAGTANDINLLSY